MLRTGELTTPQRIGLEASKALAFVAIAVLTAPEVAHTEEGIATAGVQLVSLDVPQTSAEFRTTTTHTRSTLSTQSVLDYIHHVAIPGDAWKPSQKAWVRPTSGYLKPSSVEFKTDCGKNGGPGSWGNSYSYHRFKLSSSGGLSDSACHFNSGMWRTPSKGQYDPNLRKEGHKILTGVGLAPNEQATKIAGNRPEVVAYFKSDGTPGSVLEVIIERDKSATIVRAA